MSTGLGLGGEWRRIVSAIVRGSLLFSVFRPTRVECRGGGGHGGRQVGVQGEAPGGCASASSSASVWLSKGRLVEVEVILRCELAGLRVVKGVE